MKKKEYIKVFKSCCLGLVFNLHTNQCRLFENKELDDLANNLREKAATARLDPDITLQSLDELLHGFMEAEMMKAPASPEEVIARLVERLGLPPLDMSKLPVPLDTAELRLAFIASLMEEDGARHRAAKKAFGGMLKGALANALTGSTELAEALVKAQAMGDGAEAPDGAVVAPLMVIPLKEDGTPDTERLAEYAPGTEAYEAVRRQVLPDEPNLVPGNGTVH